MLMEHKMRTYQGAFQINPNYMNLYGWAEMKKDLCEIKDEDENLRTMEKMK